MSQAYLPQPRVRIRRAFETNRLSQVYLNEAYEKIVPIHVRVVSQPCRERLSPQRPMAASTGRERRIA